MKVYMGNKKDGRNSQGGFNVYVEEDSKKHLLKHICIHSPDGYNWSYGGSGPADLALSILVDVIKVEKDAESMHQQFKWAFIARWKESFSITEEEVKEWIKGYLIGEGK